MARSSWPPAAWSTRSPARPSAPVSAPWASGWWPPTPGYGRRLRDLLATPLSARDAVGRSGSTARPRSHGLPAAGRARWPLLQRLGCGLTWGRGARAPLPPGRSHQLREEALDPGEHLWDVNPLGVGDPAAVDVGHIGVDAKDGIGPTKQVGPTGVTETRPARTPAGIGRQTQELVAVGEVGGDELGRRKHPLPGTSPPVEGRRLRQLIPGDLFLDTYAVADQIDRCSPRKGVDQPGRRKLRVLAHDTGRHRLVEHDHADIAVREARKPRPAAGAEVRVGVGSSAGVALTGIAVKG